jgi:uncharacterized protein
MFLRKKVLKSCAIFLVVIFSISSPVSAVEIPQLRSYITDEMGVLLYSDYYQATYGTCEILDQETSSEIAILIINSTEEMDIAVYAIEVFNTNGIGNKEKNNGVLIVVAVGDGTYFIAIGKGIEHILNDAKVGRFARDYFVPHAEIGDYGYGIYALTAMIAGEIAENYEQAAPHRYPIDGIPLNWPELIITFTVLIGIMVITKGKVFIWIGEYLRKFSGGKTGGGGAGGKYKK